MLRYLTLAFFLAAPAFGDDWPQWLGPKRDGVWRETGLVDKFPKDGPKQLWTTKLGAGYAGPAVADGKVFVPDRQLAAESKAPATGFATEETGGVERTICLDAATGKELWKDEYPCKYKVQYASGPRCTPLVEGEFVYTLGTMGDLRCLKVKDGSVVWSKNFVKDFAAKVPIWGFSTHPLVDGDKLLCVTGGTKENLVVALNKKTGEVLWQKESTEADCGYTPVTILEFDGIRQLIVWHGNAVLGLDPETGKRLWRQEFKTNYALTAPTPKKIGENLLVSAFYEGSMMLTPKKDSVAIAWKGKAKNEKPDGSDTLHSIMPTAYEVDGHIYGICSYGELRCLKADTGKRVWETRQPVVGSAKDEGKPVRWGNAFLTPQGDRFFLFNEQGELVIAKLTPEKYEEIDRAAIVKPTNKLAGRPVVWVHPAYANKRMYVRNDAEIVCVDLAK